LCLVFRCLSFRESLSDIHILHSHRPRVQLAYAHRIYLGANWSPTRPRWQGCGCTIWLVTPTPSTGKTTLAVLLRDYCKARRDCVVYLPGWKGDDDEVSYLTSKCEKAGYPGIQVDYFCNVDIIFILDEVQGSYDDIDLWSFIKFQNDKRIGPKFVSSLHMAVRRMEW
jgi:hypothetical protein